MVCPINSHFEKCLWVHQILDLHLQGERRSWKLIGPTLALYRDPYTKLEDQAQIVNFGIRVF